MARDEQVLAAAIYSNEGNERPIRAQCEIDPRHDHRAATAIVSGVVDVLRIERPNRLLWSEIGKLQ